MAEVTDWCWGAPMTMPRSSCTFRSKGLATIRSRGLYAGWVKVADGHRYARVSGSYRQHCGRHELVADPADKVGPRSGE